MADVKQTVSAQRAFFNSQATRPLGFRLEALEKLDQGLAAHEQDLYEAFREDLHKAPAEVYGTEIGIVRQEIALHRRKLARWAAPRAVRSSLLHFKSESRIYYQPYGVSLIIAPWNYPVHLLLAPLIGAISAGNTAVLKPSPSVPQVNAVIARMIRERFEERYIALFEGGREVNQALLAEKFDIIFCTGSPALGRVVLEQAARQMTPVTLELGGKSPCIVDRDADVAVAARRIVWGKLLNAGQTCIAPDYLFAHREVKEALVERMKEAIAGFYGPDPSASDDYPRIVNEASFDRLVGLMGRGRILAGGQTDRAARYIAPTIVDGVGPDDPIMQEEIFGPILPVLTFDAIEEVIDFLKTRPRPLALYYFSEDREKQERLIAETSAGGGCINDTMMHVGNPNLPFGGVGQSGMGSYHGYYSFETFSQKRSVIRKSTLVDLQMRYAPYGNKLRLIKALIR